MFRLPEPSDVPPSVPCVAVRDFTDGLDLDQVLLVRGTSMLPKRDGGSYLKLELGDRSGQVSAILWDGIAQVASIVREGHPVRVIGRYDVHPRHGAQITVRALRVPAPGSYDPAELNDGPVRSVEQLEADLAELVATIGSPWLRRLLDRLLGWGTDSGWRFREAPAAKHYHHPYRHGLLEHSLGVAESVSAISATYPGIDRDIAITGALLHDIGKIDAYTCEAGAMQLTDLGRLQGEIPLGYYRVRRAIEDLEGFPKHIAEHVLHIILSHHGRIEHGSPVLPATREATLVHFCDNLGGRLGSFDRLEKDLAPGAAWSPFDRALGGGAWFGGRQPEPEPEPVVDEDDDEDDVFAA